MGDDTEEAETSPIKKRRGEEVFLCNVIKKDMLVNSSCTLQTVIPCGDEFDATLEFFQGIGFKVDVIFPADCPRVAEIVGHNARLRLERRTGPPGELRLEVRCVDCEACADMESKIIAPNGTILELIPLGPPQLQIPPLRASFALSRSDSWTLGRAGMRYRDLLPGRQGERFIASLIHVPTAGPVPDWVHFHVIRLQFIYVVEGWVKVVYEDQGEPFIMHAGDCVLQPPKIRHRVIESSGGLYVVEVGCPAEHETRRDHHMQLPTSTVDPERDFDGQRFCFHVAGSAAWGPWRHDGFEARDTGIGAATAGLAGVRVVRRTNDEAKGRVRSTPRGHHCGELLFGVLLRGKMNLETPDRKEHLDTLEAFTIPAGMNFALSDFEDAEWLEVSLGEHVDFVAS